VAAPVVTNWTAREEELMSGRNVPAMQNRQRRIQEIVDWVKTSVANGELKPGERIVSTILLMDQFKASSDIVQAARTYMVEHKIVEVKRVKGSTIATYVREDVDPNRFKN
jgi:DNA-binding transcriptional regulator YhcF (GntR family)